jgi:hypothetical protein
MAMTANRKALANVTVEDADTLDCGVCYRPLRPPVYQVQTLVYSSSYT